MGLGTRNIKNIQKGARARSEGLAFEDFFVNALRRSGFRVIHLPQGAKFVAGKFGRPRLAPVKMPFDMIVSVKNKAGFFDSKSISDDNLVYSFLTPHQVDIMADLESDGHRAGYIVHFKKTGRVIFYSAQKLQALERRCSYSQDDGVDLGTLFDLKIKGLV